MTNFDLKGSPMEKNVFQTLTERGFIKQITHEGL